MSHPADESGILFRQTDRNDIGLVAHRLIEAQQSQVVLEGLRVEFRVRDNLLDETFQLRVVLLIGRQIVDAHHQGYLVGSKSFQNE